MYAELTLVGTQAQMCYGVKPCIKNARHDFIEAWKEAVYDHWETVQQIRRGECRSDRFMEFHILLSDATRTWLINIGELRRVAPGHWHLYADIDTNLRDDREALIYKVRGERREVPHCLVSYPPPRQTNAGEKALALAQELLSFSSETLTEALALARQKEPPDNHDEALDRVLSTAAKYSWRESIESLSAEALLQKATLPHARDDMGLSQMD